jgi:hypothetical protein
MSQMTVDQIIKLYGTPTAASRALGYTLQSLRNWRVTGIPPKTQLAISAMDKTGTLKVGRKK